MSEKIVVCGASGFLGAHLVADLLQQVTGVRAVDEKPLPERIYRRIYEQMALSWAAQTPSLAQAVR